MLIYKSFFFVFFISLFTQSWTQEAIFSDEAEVVITIDPIKGKYYQHKLKANQTIYRLAKFFHCSVSDIMELNGLSPSSVVHPGEDISIPFNPKFILKGGTASTYRNIALLPVFYHVQPKDNLYRIANVYFDQEIEDMMKRNNLRNSELSIDQRLLIGWMALPKVENTSQMAQFKKVIAPFTLEGKVNDDKVTLEENPITVESTVAAPEEESEQERDKDSSDVVTALPHEKVDSTSLRLKNKLYNFDTDSTMQTHIAKGIAIWNKEHKDQESLYVLHRSAKVNSIIELNYPLLKRKAFAKVVGNIPYGMYPDDVSLIISPKVAESLGARDTRFAIEMKYYE